MKRSYEKFILMESVSLFGAAILGLIALINGYPLLIIICLLLIAASLAFDIFIQLQVFIMQPSYIIKQAVRALLLILFAVALMFQL